MELESDLCGRYCLTSPINWTRLGQAIQFYEDKGYAYVEVPWAVGLGAISATLPEGKQPTWLQNGLGLIGSAEQGFVQILPSLDPTRLYCALSPCFRMERTESLTAGITQYTFMKVELFKIIKEFEKDYVDLLITDAQTFMNRQGIRAVRTPTEHGYDLMCGDLELGSYGIRSYNGVMWAYGTGLAEPRFQSAFNVIHGL